MALSPLASLQALADASGTDPNDTSLESFRRRMRARQEQDDQAAQDEYERTISQGGSSVFVQPPSAGWERMSRGGNVEQMWGPWLEAVQESADRQNKISGGISLPPSMAALASVQSKPWSLGSPSGSDQEFAAQTAAYRNRGGKTRYI